MSGFVTRHRFMRFIAALSLWLALTTATSAAGVPLPPIREPIFQLTLAPRIYDHGFTEVSQQLIQNCGINVSKNYLYRDWILASAKEPSGQYILLAGILRDNRNKDGAAWVTDPNGAFVRLRNQVCTAIDPAKGVFTAVQSYAEDPSLQIPRSVFDDLATDIIRRYARAFGSKTKLVFALHTQNRYPDTSTQNPIYQALTTNASNIPPK